MDNRKVYFSGYGFIVASDAETVERFAAAYAAWQAAMLRGRRLVGESFLARTHAAFRAPGFMLCAVDGRDVRLDIRSIS